MTFSSKILKPIKEYIQYLLGYYSIFQMMVKKDFKGRFKHTALGYAWHVINPLWQIFFYYIIFTVIFGKDIENYWVYLSTGMFAYSFCAVNITGSCNLIISNTSLVTKMNFPRELIIFSRVITNLIVLSISYVILLLLLFITGVGITVNALMLPVIVITLTIFTIGIALLLSSITVFIRDISNVVAIIMGCMMFAVPVIYLASQRSTPMMDLIWSLNPLYYFIESIHHVMYWGDLPSTMFIAMCILTSIITLIVGLTVFKKLEKKFAERL